MSFATFKLTAGPRYWHEYEGVRDQYWRRIYNLNIKDYDGDGTKDLAVEYNHIQSIWLYKGQGLWKKIWYVESLNSPVKPEANYHLIAAFAWGRL